MWFTSSKSAAPDWRSAESECSDITPLSTVFTSIKSRADHTRLLQNNHIHLYTDYYCMLVELFCCILLFTLISHSLLPFLAKVVFHVLFLQNVANAVVSHFTKMWDTYKNKKWNSFGTFCIIHFYHHCTNWIKTHQNSRCAWTYHFALIIALAQLK